MNALLSALVMSVVMLSQSETQQPAAVEPGPAATPPVNEALPVPEIAKPVWALPWLDRGAARPLNDATEQRVGRKLYLLPKSCSEGGEVDVVIHFHGSPKSMGDAFRKSSLNAVAVVVNLGALSGPYERTFEQPGSFEKFLTGIDQDLAKHCAGAKRRRLAISSWSGGYGATYRILVEQRNIALIDAVLLSDGLHSALANKFTRELKPEHLAPFTRFAALAAQGKKLMAIAHSDIVPPGYSSAAETAAFLIESQGGEKEALSERGPRPSMQLTSRGRVQGLSVHGFAGNDTKAHCDHLYAISETLFSQLEARWAK